MEFLTQLKQKKILVIVGIAILFLIVLVLLSGGEPSSVPPVPPSLP